MKVSTQVVLAVLIAHMLVGQPISFGPVSAQPAKREAKVAQKPPPADGSAAQEMVIKIVMSCGTELCLEEPTQGFILTELANAGVRGVQNILQRHLDRLDVQKEPQKAAALRETIAALRLAEGPVARLKSAYAPSKPSSR